jgi:uncharacterized protein involved in exopolysaccharide biosynthesis
LGVETTPHPSDDESHCDWIVGCGGHHLNTRSAQHVTEPDPSILRYYLGIVWRWKWLLVAPVVLLAAVALATSLRQADVWESSSGVLLNHQD